MNKEDICPHCRGLGEAMYLTSPNPDDASYSVECCRGCSGSGFQVHYRVTPRLDPRKLAIDCIERAWMKAGRG